jgi:hypothetical protein
MCLKNNTVCLEAWFALTLGMGRVDNDSLIIRYVEECSIPTQRSWLLVYKHIFKNLVWIN